MAHDFKRFPELVGDDIDLYYFDSPHKQIFEDFWAKCVKVTDGDTIRVTMDERDFDFPVRFANIAAPEKGEEGGMESKNWLEKEILGEEVFIEINRSNRVGKWGRLIGEVKHMGLDVGETSMSLGFSKPWNLKNDGKIPSLDEVLSSG